MDIVQSVLCGKVNKNLVAQLNRLGGRAVGLCGMEAWYARFTDEQTQILLDICHAFGVLPSGGSDYHGDRKPDIALGTGCHGNLHVPYEAFQNLQRAAHL